MIKIPSALKWMLDRRARLLGEIQKTEKRQRHREEALSQAINVIEARLKTLKRRLQVSRTGTPLRLAALKVDLAAIDNAMGQHRVMVDAESIPAIKSQDNPWHLPRGQITRSILRCLREAEGAELTTSEIALYVAVNSRLDIDPNDFRPFKIAVRKRMRAMTVEGTIRRVGACQKLCVQGIA